MRIPVIAPLENVEDALYSERSTVTISLLCTTSEGEVVCVKASKPDCDFSPEEQFLASSFRVSYYIATKGGPRLYLTGTGKLSPLKHRKKLFDRIEDAWIHLGILRDPENFEIIKRKVK